LSQHTSMINFYTITFNYLILPIWVIEGLSELSI
jgi:hypothetical protein